MSPDNKLSDTKQGAVHYLSNEVSIKEILLGITRWFTYVLSQWKWILLAMLICSVLNFIRVSRQKLLYIASSTFVLQENTSAGLAPSNAFAAILGLNGPEGGGLFQGDNLLELYRSRLMIKKALLSKVPDSTDYLIDRYIKINNLRAAWIDKPQLRRINFFFKGNKQYARKQDSLMNIFTDDIRNNYLNVDRVGRLSIFRVEIRSPNEEFSKLFNDQIVKTVNDFYILTKVGKSTENLKLLQHQVDSIRAALNGAMYKVASSIDVNINANPARQILRLPSQRSQVDAENNRAMLEELVRNVEISKMSLQKETPLIETLDAPVYPLEKRHESQLKALIIGGILGLILAVALCSLILLRKNILA